MRAMAPRRLSRLATSHCTMLLALCGRRRRVTYASVAAGVLLAAGGVLAPSDFVSDFVSAFASAPDSDGAAAAPFVEAFEPFAPFEPPRKSVTYQPEPLSWNPAAVTCLRNESFSHCGHWVSGASLIFWSTSFSKPHDSQR